MKLRQLSPVLAFAFALAGPVQASSEVTATCSLLSDIEAAPVGLGISVAGAEALTQEILASIGLRPNFEVLATVRVGGYTIDNAAAMLLKRPGDPGLGNRFIVYNPRWMADMIARDRWQAIAVLSHEIGHHLQGHTYSCQGSDHQKEIEADEFAGRILGSMGASLPEAQSLWQAFPVHGSATHPGRQDRLEAVERGWRAAAPLRPQPTPTPTPTPSPTPVPTPAPPPQASVPMPVLLYDPWVVILGSYPKNQLYRAQERTVYLQQSGLQAVILDTDFYGNLTNGLYAVVLGASSRGDATQKLNRARAYVPDAYIKTSR